MCHVYMLVCEGQDRSVGVLNEPKLHLDLMPNEVSFVNLSTPPRVLTLDDRPFPAVDDERREQTGNYRFTALGDIDIILYLCRREMFVSVVTLRYTLLVS